MGLNTEKWGFYWLKTCGDRRRKVEALESVRKGTTEYV